MIFLWKSANEKSRINVLHYQYSSILYTRDTKRTLVDTTWEISKSPKRVYKIYKKKSLKKKNDKKLNECVFAKTRGGKKNHMLQKSVDIERRCVWYSCNFKKKKWGNGRFAKFSRAAANVIDTVSHFASHDTPQRRIMHHQRELAKFLYHWQK